MLRSDLQFNGFALSAYDGLKTGKLALACAAFLLQEVVAVRMADAYLTVFGNTDAILGTAMRF